MGLAEKKTVSCVERAGPSLLPNSKFNLQGLQSGHTKILLFHGLGVATEVQSLEGGADSGRHLLPGVVRKMSVRDGSITRSILYLVIPACG